MLVNTGAVIGDRTDRSGIIANVLSVVSVIFSALKPASRKTPTDILKQTFTIARDAVSVVKSVGPGQSQWSRRACSG